MTRERSSRNPWNSRENTTSPGGAAESGILVRRSPPRGAATPQTFTQLHYHIVFSTKNREPLLTDEIRERVWEYLGGIVRGEGGTPILAGGMPDHVHLLATLSQTRSVADIVRQLKAGSSGWAHEKFPDANLWWQAGYGAFSVSHSAVDAVREYIERQEDHHRQISFQDEFRAFLRKHGLAPDEDHMWG